MGDLLEAYPDLGEAISRLCDGQTWRFTGASALLFDATHLYLEITKPKHWRRRADGATVAGQTRDLAGIGAIGGSLEGDEGVLACLRREVQEEIGAPVALRPAAETHLVYEERTIDPYFIQPSALEHAIYIIAYCHLRAGLRVFRLDRIAGATALESTYVIPNEFDANEFLNSFWGITATGKPRTVRLWFHPHIARIAAETVWHTSQTTAAQTNGAAIVTIKVALTRDLVAFVLGWSDMVKVLAPRDLQVRVAGAARRVHQLYSEAGPPTAIAPPPVWEVDDRQLKLFP